MKRVKIRGEYQKIFNYPKKGYKFNQKLKEDHALQILPEIEIGYCKFEKYLNDEFEDTYISYKSDQEYCIAKSWCGAQITKNNEKIDFDIGNSKP